MGANFLPVELDPRIGRFEIHQINVDYKGKLYAEITDSKDLYEDIIVPIKQLDLKTDDPKGLFKWFPRDQLGLYTNVDDSELELRGSTYSDTKQVVQLFFSTCKKELDDSCAEPSEVQAFLAAH